RLAARADCEPDDSQSPQTWLASVCQALASAAAPDPNASPDSDSDAGADARPGTTTSAPAQPGHPAAVSGTSGTSGAPASATAVSAVAVATEAESPSAQSVAQPATFNKRQPLPSALRVNRVLNAPGSEKETRQIVLGLGEARLDYEAGDALGVWPTNCPALVADVLTALRLPSSAPVTLPEIGELPLSQALLRHLEIARITPDLLGFVRERSGSAALAERLQPAHAQDLRQWLWGRQIIDLLEEFPIRPSAQDWVNALKRLQPRLYSIASSPKAQAGEVHLTVSTVRHAHHGKPRHGVCSTFLADRADTAEVPVFVQKSAHFRLPAAAGTPIVMVGPGTGVAPFRGFLHERRARGDSGRNWLFFGEQHAATDFYYRDELQAMQQDGLLSQLSLAFSRDQERKIYVQDRLREHGAQLWAWLQDGAHFYVCGDASRMARDVDQALRDVAQQHGGLSAEQAAAYVRQLAADKRYARDVY
ncbi:MAG: sulfite reductase subunit alpha, partial [Comamonas sp.]